MSAPAFSLHHVSLYVHDQDRSAAFYAGVLGLAEIPNRVGRAHIRWFDLDGLRTIHLIGGDAEAAERPRPFSTHMALVTPDLDGLMRRLQEANVTFVDVARRPGVHVRADGIRQIYFQDPDGHWIEVNDALEGP